MYRVKKRYINDDILFLGILLFALLTGVVGYECPRNVFKKIFLFVQS